MVSIKNIPAGGSDKVVLFILISVAVHALTLILLGNSPGALSWLLAPEPDKFSKERPLTVELLDPKGEEEREKERTVEVVEVPDDPSKESSPPEEIVRYARSSRRAEVEEFPEETVPSGGQKVIFPSQKRGAVIITKARSLKDKPGEKGERQGGKTLKEEKAALNKTVALKEKPPPAAKKTGDVEPSVKVDQSSGAKERLEDIALLNGDLLYPSPLEKSIKVVGGDAPEKATTPLDKSIGTAGKSQKTETAPGGAERVMLIPSPGRLSRITKDTERYEGHVPTDARRGMTSLLLNTTEFKYQEYFMHIKRKINFYWEYPSVAARLGQQGRLQINYTIMKDGSVTVDDIDLVKSSNYSILDDAAITAIRLASPFNPFPKGFEHEEIQIHHSFKYSHPDDFIPQPQ